MAACTRNRWKAVLILSLLAASGCARRPGDALRIATTWPKGERQRLEADYGQWSSAGGIPIVWVSVARDDELARLVERDPAIDLVLGGTQATFERLAQGGRLGPAPIEGSPLWAVLRRAPIGLAVEPKAFSGRAVTPDAAPAALGRFAQRGPLALDDPRVDPLSLASARAALAAHPWAEGYAALVRSAGHARPFGRSPGAALASLERGEAVFAPTLFPRQRQPGSRPILPLEGSPEEVDGIAITAGAPLADQARSFLQLLQERGELSAPVATTPADPVVDSLLADLLGATLVDAQDELRAAWTGLARGDGPSTRDEMERWMAESPPWPPASVEAIRRSAEPGPLLDTLIQQLTTQSETRQWLLVNFDGAGRPIDGNTLRILAEAADGHLAAEPRFRAWLRAEWTAWARQRYRAVARPAEDPPS
jgi:hypothetical protein